MIHLSISTMLAAFVGFPLALIGALALFYSLKSRHRQVSETESIYVCTHCRHVYAFARTRPMDRCPRCGHLNDAVRT